jgi:hypothetical protein
MRFPMNGAVLSDKELESEFSLLDAAAQCLSAYIRRIKENSLRYEWGHSLEWGFLINEDLWKRYYGEDKQPDWLLGYPVRTEKGLLKNSIYFGRIENGVTARAEIANLRLELQKLSDNTTDESL